MNKEEISYMSAFDMFEKIKSQELTSVEITEIIIERIEKIRFFRRYEAEWTAPYRWYMKIFYLFVNAPKAFHDINHKRSKAPGWLILLFCSLLY